jgi:cell division protein FtsQ
MTTMEPKLAERRKGVSEDRARGRLKWVLIIIVFLLAVVGGVWLIRSPLLSIKTVTVTGATMSNPLNFVNDLGMGQGTPTIDVDGQAIERAILADPWVREARVTVGWPGRIEIAVLEHTLFASVLAADGWVRVSVEGSVLAVDEPMPDAPVIEIDAGPVPAGYSISNPLIVGALEFAAALPTEMARRVVITDDGEGLIASVDGHQVVLGRPAEMREKAIVLASLIDNGLEAGAHVNLIAPLRPAVTNPQPLQEVEQ